MFDYTSACCRLPAVKPPCGQKESVINPETKKSKAVPKGLGHWRCTGCRKSCLVTVSKHKVAEVTPAPSNGIA